MNKLFALFSILLFSTRSFIQVILPENDFIPGWKKSEPVRHFAQSNLYDHIDGGADIFLEFGFNELFVQDYAKSETHAEQKQEQEIDLEIYRMESPASALGVFLMKRGKQNSNPEIPAENSSNRYQITMVKGECFVQINNFSGDEAMMPVMVMFAKHVLKTIAPGEPVTILDSLPKENLVPGSELIVRGQYALQPIYTFGQGDILQLDGRIFGVVADYTDLDSSLYTQLIIPYPDEKKSHTVYQNLIRNLDPYLEIIAQEKSNFVFKDYREKFGVVEVSGRVLRIKINLTKIPE